jgi:hypothetical protein
MPRMLAPAVPFTDAVGERGQWTAGHSGRRELAVRGRVEPGVGVVRATYVVLGATCIGVGNSAVCQPEAVSPVKVTEDSRVPALGSQRTDVRTGVARSFVEP